MNSVHYLQYGVSWASIALLYYDYALTFGMEVKYIWTSTLCLSNVVYIGCRYALVANVLYLISMSDERCNTWSKIVADALGVVGRASVLVAFTARTYAVYSQNKCVLAYLGALGIAIVITDSINVHLQMACDESRNASAVSLTRSLLTIIFETSSALLITLRTVKAFKLYGSRTANRRNILYLIFEDGLLYFGFISIFTVATFVLKLRAPPGLLRNLLNAFTLPLSTILTARFILHLRSWKDKQIVQGVVAEKPPGTRPNSSSQSYPTPQSLTHFDPYTYGPSGSKSEFEAETNFESSRPEMVDVGDFGEDPHVTAMNRKEETVL